MDRREVDILSSAINMAVLRLPTRKFPGILIQGDTFCNYVVIAQQILEVARRAGSTDIAELATQLTEDLEEKLRHYEEVLGRNGIMLPHVSPFGE